MRLYSVTKYQSHEEPKTVWVKTQAEAKALKREWIQEGAGAAVLQRGVPTSKDELCRWLNHHVTGRPNV